MIYLDYSATTPTDKEVLASFVETTQKYFGNPNSLHKLGGKARALIEASTSQIANILGVKPNEIIYTSGASESNNTALKGVALSYQNRGKHIITTPLEHSSVLETLHYLETLGFEVSYVQLTENGTIDFDNLKSLIRKDTILVSIASISSELGIRQDIDKIGKILKDYPKIIFHSDITQSLGKEKVNLQNVDLASFSAQKFYGLKGTGGLYKRENIKLVPLIHGGRSTTIYRSGTPVVANIVALAKALRLCYEDFEEKTKKVKELNDNLIMELKKIEGICINSTEASIPNIINISVLDIKPETLLHALEEEEIYLSTKSACSSKNEMSKAVYALTNNKEQAQTSIRISLSHLTKKEELDEFIKVLKEKISHLKNIKK